LLIGTGTYTSIKSGELKLVLWDLASPFSEIMWNACALQM